jgi:hypothetical protein
MLKLKCIKYSMFKNLITLSFIERVYTQDSWGICETAQSVGKFNKLLKTLAVGLVHCRTSKD